MIDVKKLMVGFLILAAAASGSGLILSFVNLSPSTPTPSSGITLNTGVSSSTVDEYLPTESSQDAALAASSSAVTAAIRDASDTTNLTSAFADAYVSGVISANPDGATVENGTTTLAAPDANAVTQQIISSPALESVTAPNWDAEANAQPIKTSSDASPSAIAAYSQALNNAVDQNLVATNVQSIVSNSNDADPSQTGFIQSKVQATLSDTVSIPTPAPLVNFQKSFVTALVYQKNILQLAENMNTDPDPIKDSLVMQDEETKYNEVMQSFQTQMKAAAGINGFAFGTAPQQSENKAFALFDNVMGIHTANAQWITFDASNFGEWILKFAEDTALQIVKNTLVAIIQKKVLAYIQGSGAPKFITNWASTVVNAYQQTAINALNGQMQCVYTGISGQIQLTLGAFYKPGNNVCANQFQSALGGHTLQQFYNNFTSGGWVAFNSSLLPSNNYYGGLFFAAQAVGGAANTAVQNTQAQNTAGNGLTGSSVCADGSNPNTGTHTVCVNPDGSNYIPDGLCADGNYIVTGGQQCDDGSAPKPQPCDPSDKPTTYPNAGVCANGSTPNLTTPPVFTGMSAADALDSSPKEVAAANSIAGLLNALTSSLLSGLANAAISEATNLTNSVLNSNSGSGGILSISSSSIQGGGTPAPSLPLSCNPALQNASSGVSATIGAVGGTPDANGNPPIYSWVSSPDGATSTGYIFYPTYNTPGTYTVTISDSTGDATSTCAVVVH